MTRRIALCLTLVALLLAGCADLAQLLPEEDTPEPLEMQSPPTAEPFPPEISTAARIQERGALIVGIRYDLEPFSYIAADGMLAGLEIDLARELARRWLGDAEAVRFVQVRSDTAVQHLQEGNIDVALAGIVHSQNLAGEVDFSPPYFTNGLALLSFPDAGIAAAPDLSGRNVGLLTWTGSGAVLEATVEVTPTYAPYNNFYPLIEALRTRQVDAYVDQRHRLERARRMVAGTEIVSQMTAAPVAMIYRENDPFFADLVAATFAAMAEDGTRDTLYARWLPGTSPPSLPDWRGTPVAPPLESAPRERATLDTAAGIRERGVLEVGYFPDRWPYSADRGDGVQTGFEVRLVELMAERWLGSRQAVTFVPVDEATAFEQLQAGELDLLVGAWIRNWDAEAYVDFSHTIMDDGVGILSLAGNPINALSEVGGQSVGVIAGSEGEAALPEISQAAGVGVNAVPYPDLDSAVSALQSGEVAVLVAERYLLLDPLYRVGGFYLTDERFTHRPVAFVLPRGDSDFRDLVNLTLARLHADGSFAELYTTWFDDPVPPPPPWPGEPLISLTLVQ